MNKEGAIVNQTLEKKKVGVKFYAVQKWKAPDNLAESFSSFGFISHVLKMESRKCLHKLVKFFGKFYDHSK